MYANKKDEIRHLHTPKTLKQIQKAYPCQRQGSLFTYTAADPQFSRLHSLAEIFAKNIKTVVTCCTCQDEKQTNRKQPLWMSIENQQQTVMKAFCLTL